MQYKLTCCLVVALLAMVSCNESDHDDKIIKRVLDLGINPMGNADIGVTVSNTSRDIISWKK